MPSQTVREIAREAANAEYRAWQRMETRTTGDTPLVDRVADASARAVLTHLEGFPARYPDASLGDYRYTIRMGLASLGSPVSVETPQTTDPEDGAWISRSDRERGLQAAFAAGDRASAGAPVADCYLADARVFLRLTEAQPSSAAAAPAVTTEDAN